MSAHTYDDILLYAERLPAAEQLRLMKALFGLFDKQFESLKSVENTIPQVEEDLKSIEDAIVHTRQKIGSQKLHSIVELRGLGKEIWEGIDAQKYVDQERDSWD